MRDSARNDAVERDVGSEAGWSEERPTQPSNVRQAPGHVLVVDDDPMVCRALTRMVHEAGHAVRSAVDGESAVALFREHQFDTVVSDISMPGLDGIALLRAIRQADLDIPVILVTGAPTVDSAVSAVEYGAFHYLIKPVDRPTLKSTVSRAVRLYRLARLRRELLEHAGNGDWQIADRAGLEVRLEQAMAGLYMHYQPIVRWPERSVHGYEALVRSNEESLPHPGALFDAAERLDRLVDLGRAIRTRCSTPMDHADPNALLFVNLHTRDLLDDDLFSRDTPLSRIAHRVVLEITERARLEQITDVQTRISALREMGFRIALDDMGAGYAGLASFALLEPDVVKLDMGLVRGVDTKSTKRKLIRSLMGLCADLGMEVVAEGVETAAERDALVDLGCRLFQGFFFAKPGAPFPEPSFDGE